MTQNVAKVCLILCPQEQLGFMLQKFVALEGLLEAEFPSDQPCSKRLRPLVGFVREAAPPMPIIHTAPQLLAHIECLRKELEELMATVAPPEEQTSARMRAAKPVPDQDGSEAGKDVAAPELRDVEPEPVLTHPHSEGAEEGEGEDELGPRVQSAESPSPELEPESKAAVAADVQQETVTGTNGENTKEGPPLLKVCVDCDHFLLGVGGCSQLSRPPVRRCGRTFSAVRSATGQRISQTTEKYCKYGTHGIGPRPSTASKLSTTAFSCHSNNAPPPLFALSWMGGMSPTTREYCPPGDGAIRMG